jgi:hypothetical protein
MFCVGRGNYREEQKAQTHSNSRPVVRVREIIQTNFSSPTSMGLIRLREHELFANKMDVDGLTKALTDLFS